jgi:hypothetical protein
MRGERGMTTVEITLFEKEGGPLSKRIHLVDGKIENDDSACRMARGTATRLRIDLGNTAAFAQLISGFTPRQAYALGRIKAGLPDTVPVATNGKLAEAQKTDPNTIARSLDYLGYVKGEPGLMLFDHDRKGMPDAVARRVDEAGGFWAALCTVFPALKTAARVERASTSSGLKNTATGDVFPGNGGSHDTVAVADASDIPRALSACHDRLTLAGFGWGMGSACGSFLDRSPVDKACGSAERLVFEGGPIVEPPLEQAPRPAVAHEGDVIDTMVVFPPLTAAERFRVKELKEAERIRLMPELDALRERWSETHVKRMVANGATEDEARATVDRWIDRKELTGAFALPFDDPNLAGATVADVLASPKKYVEKTLADPFEGPAYGRGKAILYQRANGSLFVNSFAHGGAVYELKAPTAQDVEAEIERLARLDLLAYALAKKEAAKRLGLNPGDLEKLVKAKREALNPPPPPPDEVKLLLDTFNREYAVVRIGAQTRVMAYEETMYQAGGETYTLCTPIYQKFSDFRDYYRHRYCITSDLEVFAKDAEGAPLTHGVWWLGNPGRRTYRGVVFFPGRGPIIDGKLNLWTGFAIKPKRGHWPRTRADMFEVLAARDAAFDAYQVNWLAHAVQHPDQQAEVAVALIGGQGTGRGLLGRAMCRIFGQHGQHISSTDHLTGKFNAHLQLTAFLFADEAVAPQDKKAEGVMKRTITEDTLFIEPKGINGFKSPNWLHVSLASNHHCMIAAEEKERRYAAQEVAKSHQQDERWFKPIFEELPSGGYAAMLYDLLDHNLGDFHPRQIVRTAALGKQQEESLSPLDAWWLELLQTGVLAGTCGVKANEAVSNSFEEEVVAFRDNNSVEHMRTVKREGLYDQARRISPRLKGATDAAFGRYLSHEDRGCVGAWVKRRRGWRFKSLADCRDKWFERSPLTVWAAPSPADWTFGDDDET